MTLRRFICALAACAALAAASLLLAEEPVYDAWSWLVWGRELTQLELDTTSGPTWKPLPVLLAAPLTLAGDAAPELWLVLVRTAFVLSFVLVADLAHLLTAGRPRVLRLAAAGFAVAVLALLSDDTTTWALQAAGGMSEPLLVALVLGAVRAALGGHARLALVLGALAALARPEAWPLLALYALWCARREPRSRALVYGLALAVPVAWLVPELVGSGGGGAERAQRATGDPREALERAFALPLAVAWPLALAALLHSRAARVLAAGAIGWIAIVAATTLIDFPGLARFMAPPAAIVGVLGGVGLAALLADLRAPRGAGRSAAAAAGAVAVAAALALIVTALGLPDRVSELAQGWRSSARSGQSHDRVRALIDSAGGERLLRCGRLATSDTLVRTALAWHLGVPLSRVVSFGDPPRLSGAFVVDGEARPWLVDHMEGVATQIGRVGEWRAYSIACPAIARSSPQCSAGVSGAMR